MTLREIRSNCGSLKFQTPKARLQGSSGLFLDFSWVTRKPEVIEHAWLAGLPETWARRKNHSERSACMTSTRAARAAGSIDATTAAPRSTNAEPTPANAQGILKSPK